MTILFTEPSFVPVSGNSVVYPGAKLYFYATETSTPQNTYSEYTLTTAHANPVVADADGRFAPIYLDPSLEDYKVVLKDSSDVTIWTVDPYSAGSITANASTISELLALDGTINPNARINGYHTAGDGGGGDFYWDASQNKANHNGGTIIDPDITFPSDWTNATQVTTWFTAGTGTGCWMLIYKTGVSVKQFGAKGDASTDDTKMFQAAVDSGVKRVEVPPAIYHVTSIDVSNSRGLTIEGTGHGELGQLDGTAVLNLIADTSMFVATGPGTIIRLGFTLKNITCIGDAANRSAGTFFDISGEARRIYIRDCYVVNFRDFGVKVVDTGGVFIYHTDIFNCGYNLYGDGWADSGVYGGQTGSGKGGGAPWVIDNILLKGAGGNTPFVNHRPNFSKGVGVRIQENVSRVSFIGGLCDNNIGGGFSLEGNCTAIKIIGMDIFDNGQTYNGTHTGGTSATTLTHTTNWVVDEFIGQTIENLTDGSTGVVTSNSVNSIVCSGGLSGGTDNTWQTGDTFFIAGVQKPQIDITTNQFATGFYDGPAGIEITGNSIFDRRNGEVGQAATCGIDLSALSKVAAERVSIVGNSLTSLPVPIIPAISSPISRKSTSANSGVVTELSGVTSNVLDLTSTAVQSINGIDVSALSSPLHANSIIILHINSSSSYTMVFSLSPVNHTSGTTFDIRFKLQTATTGTASVAWHVLN